MTSRQTEEPGRTVTINISGQLFTVFTKTLARYEGSKLHRISRHRSCANVTLTDIANVSTTDIANVTSVTEHTGNANHKENNDTNTIISSHKGSKATDVTEPNGRSKGNALTIDVHSVAYVMINNDKVLFYDRNPTLFSMVLDIYRTGILHVRSENKSASTANCPSAILNELKFWELPLDEIQICNCSDEDYRLCFDSSMQCTSPEMYEDSLPDDFRESDTDLRAGRWSIIRKRKSEDVGSRRSRIFPKNRSTVPAGTHSESNKMSAYSWRRRIWLILEEPSSSMIARIWCYIYMFLVVLAIGCACAETAPSCRIPATRYHPAQDRNFTNPKVRLYVITEVHPVIQILDGICAVIFVIELLLRFIVWPNKFGFITSFFNIIDILAIIPMVITNVINIFDQQFWLDKEMQVGHSVLAISSICRSVRVLKMVKHHRGLQLMYKAIKISFKEILLLFLLMTIGMLVFASLIYYAEFTDPTDTFATIPIGFWWSIVTMTTVGYGDKYPVTVAGYIIGSMCAVIGMLLTGLPIPVIASNFTRLYAEEEQRKRRRKRIRTKSTVFGKRSQPMNGRRYDEITGSRKTPSSVRFS